MLFDQRNMLTAHRAVPREHRGTVRPRPTTGPADQSRSGVPALAPTTAESVGINSRTIGAQSIFVAVSKSSLVHLSPLRLAGR